MANSNEPLSDVVPRRLAPSVTTACASGTLGQNTIPFTRAGPLPRPVESGARARRVIARGIPGEHRHGAKIGRKLGLGGKRAKKRSVVALRGYRIWKQRSVVM